MVVFTGLMKLLKNDDELAAVLAHEVAHVLARHAVRAHAEPCRATHNGQHCVDVATGPPAACLMDCDLHIKSQSSPGICHQLSLVPSSVLTVAVQRHTISDF